MRARGERRDYLAGSVLVGLSLRFLGWFPQRTDRLLKRALTWAGVNEVFRRANPWRTLCAILATAIVANGITLWLTHKEIALWGVVLRLIGLLAASLGLVRGSDWPLLRETSLLIRLFRVFREGN